MKIWLYSSGDLESNRHIDEALLRQIGKRRPRYCYVPSAFEDSEYYFEEFSQRFGSYGPCSFQTLHLDRPLQQRDLVSALGSDLIYLSGGNTFYFLKHIRSSGIESEFYTYLRAGGIMAGHSAGAIVMTPTISTASYPEDDRDDNDVGLTNLKAMKFCSFEIFPHYLVRSRNQNAALRAASKNLGHVIYGLPDGAAVAINGPSLTVYGPVWGFVEGQRFSIKT